MIMLSMGLGIHKHTGLAGAGGIPPVGITATMEYIGDPSFQPTITAGQFQIVLSETRLVDTDFLIALNDNTGFTIDLQPVTVPAGLLTANGSISGDGTNIVNPVIVSATADDVTVLNDLSYEVIPPP